VTRLTYTGNPDQDLKAVYEAQKKEYDEMYRPVNREMIASINSTEMVDTAKANANTDFDAMQGQSQRMASRFGLSYNPAEQAELANRTAGARALNYTNVVNNAQTNQYERNMAMQDQMINVGRGIAQSGVSNMNTAANAKNQRDMTNDSIDAQNKAAKYNSISQMVQLGAMIALM